MSFSPQGFRVSTISDVGFRKKLNEDMLLVRKNLFAVFDGATSRVSYTSKNGKTGGRIAAETAKNIFLKKRGSLRHLAIEANRALRRAMHAAGIDTGKREALWATAVSAVQLQKKSVSYLGVNDSLVLVIFTDGSHRLLTPHVDHDRATLIKWRILAKKRVKNIYEVLRSYMDAVRRRANKDYGSLNGEKEVVRFFSTGKIAKKNIATLILFTDGFFIPRKNPRVPEQWDLFVRLYRRSGLRGILRYIRSFEKKDPECWMYPRLKQYDDATAIAIDFL